MITVNLTATAVDFRLLSDVSSLAWVAFRLLRSETWILDSVSEKNTLLWNVLFANVVTTKIRELRLLHTFDLYLGRHTKPSISDSCRESVPQHACWASSRLQSPTNIYLVSVKASQTAEIQQLICILIHSRKDLDIDVRRTATTVSFSVHSPSGLSILHHSLTALSSWRRNFSAQRSSDGIRCLFTARSSRRQPVAYRDESRRTRAAIQAHRKARGLRRRWPTGRMRRDFLKEPISAAAKRQQTDPPDWSVGDWSGSKK